jgi:hypothetical protein
MIQNYEIMFNESPKEASSPMLDKDHPELDLSEELGPEDIKRYQSLIGALQWLLTLGCFDILVGVATMGSFHVAPHIGHLKHFKRSYFWLH